MSPGQYELIDFGEGEKLESFAGTIVRRETRSAIGRRSQNDQWNRFDLHGKQSTGGSRWLGTAPDHWWFDVGAFRLALRTTPTGQLGVFPEQIINWKWIADASLDLNGMRAINLFAYTGGTTLALASRGVHVVHVDAAKSVVNWARSNAKDSGLANAPIRWIVEDAFTFVRREINRGKTYDVVVADPPSFGRGPKGELWKLQRDIDYLIESLALLTASNCRMMLVSCHTPGVDHVALERSAKRVFDFGLGRSESFEMSIKSSSGKKHLPSGSCFRWMAESVGSNLES